MKVVYIIGPFRADNAWEIEQNVRHAEEMALQIWRMGAAVICPHTNTRFFHGAAPDDVWLTGDLEILKRCDAAFCTGQWRTSPGSMKEIALCTAHSIPVFASIGELSDFLVGEARE